MTIGAAGQAYTDQFPGQNETKFYLAPQTDKETPAATGFQGLHYLTYAPSRSQGEIDEREYGGDNDSVDPSDPAFDQPTFDGQLTTRLCLNELIFPLAYLFGAPTTTDVGGGLYQHVFESGKPILPLATGLDVTPQSNRTVAGIAMNSLQGNIDSAGGTQEMSYDFQAKNLDMSASAAPSGGDVTAPPTRLFVARNKFEGRIDGVKVGHLLDANFNYTTDIQSENYVDANDQIGALYVGDPSLTLTANFRNVTEAQRAALGGTDNPFEWEFFAQGPSGSSISLKFNRMKGSPVFPEADNRLGRLSLTANGSKTEGAAPKNMITATIINSLATT